MPKRARDLTLFLCFVVLCAAIAEVVVRFVDRREGPEIGPGGNHPRGLFVAAPATGYALRPGFVGRMTNPFGDFDVEVKIDRRGNRDRDEPIAPDAVVVLGVGDSFTYGEGVERDSTYLAHLERGLEAGLGRPVRVVSAGVPGYGARQMLARCRVLLESTTPQIVLLGLAPGGGDRLDDPFVEHEGYIVRSSYSPRLVSVGPRLVETASTRPWIRFAESRAKAHSHVVRRLATLASSLEGDGSSGRSAPSQDPYAALRTRRAPAWADSMRAIVREFAEICREIDARAIVLLVDSTPAQEESVLRAIEESGADAVRLANALDAHRRASGESIVFEHDDHWNEAGHRAVAGILLERMLRGAGAVADAGPPAQISTSSPKSSFTSSPSRSSRT